MPEVDDQTNIKIKETPSIISSYQKEQVQVENDNISIETQKTTNTVATITSKNTTITRENRALQILLTKTIYDEENDNKVVRKTLRGVTYLVFI